MSCERTPTRRNSLARFIVVSKRSLSDIVLLVFLVLVYLIVQQHANDSFIVAFTAKLEESARLSLFGVGFEVALFGE